MSNIVEYLYTDIGVGDSAQFVVEITDELVHSFATMTGDTNPLHMDDVYAATTQFKGRIAHGMLGASLFSRLIGMHLPGKYALYLSQSSTFRAPMRIGMKLTVTGTILQKIDAAQALRIQTHIVDSEHGTLLIDGEAMVKIIV